MAGSAEAGSRAARWGAPSALFLLNEREAVPGWIGERAAARGLAVLTCDPLAGGPLPDPRAFALVVPLGARLPAGGSEPEVVRQLEFLTEALASAVPVFGICFGAQLVARVLGGEVFPAATPEFGWQRIETADPELVPPGPWLQWHTNTFHVPDEVEVVATSAAGPQAFVTERAVGVQFHPEVPPATLTRWVAGSADALASRGVDRADLVATARRQAPAARQRAHRLFDAVWERIGTAPAER